MILLEAFNIEKYYGDRLILKIPELRIYEGDRIGIVGVNGAGKTTLMDILSGKLHPDQGTCTRYCDVAFIQQFSDETAVADGKTLNEFSLKGKTKRERLSGGEQTRIRITNALSKNHPLLFADEPTSNLDYKGIELLNEKLWTVGSLLVISHDRELLDEQCSKMLEVKDGAVRMYEGNYSAYLEQSRSEYERASLEYEQYREEKARLEQIHNQKKTKAKSITKKPKGMSDSDYKTRKFTASKAYEAKQQGMERSAKAVLSRIDQLDVKEKPSEIPKIKLNFELTNPPRNKILLSAKNLSFSYGDNTIFQDTGFEIQNRSKTVVVGENGAGKSTLFHLIANGAEDIYKVPKAKIGYFHQDFSNLNFEKSVLDNVMSTSIQDQSTTRCILARLLFQGESVYKKVKVLSGGEKIRLALAKLLTSDANVLLLDEPTNYLDIYSIEAVQALLEEYEGTLIMATHDKAIANKIANQLLIIKNKKLLPYQGNLEAYENRNMKKDTTDADRLLLEMRLSKILADISMDQGKQAELEKEYNQILSQLKTL